jgi:hypothetical protein
VSLNLEFYAVAWADIAEAVGSSDRRLFGRILKKTEPYFDEIFEPEDFDDGPDFELGLERWIEGELENGAGNSPFSVVNLGDALGFLGLVRFYGRLVGTLNHSMTGGDLFRDEFLLGVAQDVIHPPYSFELLVSRPILGYERDDFPYWGGLGRMELNALKAVLGQDAPTWENNPDIDSWLAEFWSALASTVGEGKDLITIYS